MEQEEVSESWNEAELQQLLVSRLWVARLGEGDVLGWWRTEGILGSDGAFVGPRVLAKTHRSGRARIAFAVAQYACRERYKDEGAIHLFRLDPWTEDALDTYIHERLADRDFWSKLFEPLEKVEGSVEPSTVLLEHHVVGNDAVASVKAEPLGPDGRSLRLPRAESRAEALRFMAAGFTRGAAGELVVPFVPVDDWGSNG